MKPKVYEYPKINFKDVSKKLILLFCFAPLLMATTCDDDEHYGHHPCTDEARAALNVTVTLNGAAITSDQGISVTARDGNYIEDLVTYGEPPFIFSGAYERMGDYTIMVAKEGYQTYVSNTIRILHDECHVIPRQLTVDLIPNP